MLAFRAPQRTAPPPPLEFEPSPRALLSPAERLATLEEIDGGQSYFDQVIFEPGDRFAFPDEDHTGAPAEPALLVACRDEDGRIVDIAAFGRSGDLSREDSRRPPA